MKWRRWLRRDDREADLERELSFHIDERVADMVRSGVSKEDAPRQVRLEFGAAERVKDECRDVRPARWAETFVQDVRYASNGVALPHPKRPVGSLAPWRLGGILFRSRN